MGDNDITQPLTVAEIDPVIVDAYALDLDGKINWNLIVAAGPPWCGAIIKCTEGISYAPGWFIDTWRGLDTIVPKSRKGVDWFRGAYHYWRAGVSSVAQADLYLSMIDAGGGWSVADLWPIVDVENAGNQGAGAAEVVDGVSAFADRILQRTGRRPMLYGGSFIRDLGIRDHMDCSLLWTARYASTLPPSTYEDMGWTRDRLWGWQYIGTDGTPTGPVGYPRTTPAGRLDISAMVIDDAKGHEAPLIYTASRSGSNTR